MQSELDFEFHVTSKGIHIPWSCVEACVESIHRQWETYRPERVLALGKGAMIPARLLAKEKTPIFYTGVRSYEEKEHVNVTCYQQPCDGDYITDPSFLNDLGTLIVDDLWDTGATFEWAIERWPRARRAALVSKKEVHGLTFAGLVLPTSSWIIFPWEK